MSRDDGDNLFGEAELDACLERHGLAVPSDQKARVLAGARWLRRAVSRLREVPEADLSPPDEVRSRP